MPKNPPGEVNLNSWYPTRPWSISLAKGAATPIQTAQWISDWATERRSNGACFLAGQVTELVIGMPDRVCEAFQINGEINPEHATYCSDASSQRLIYRLTRLLMQKLGTKRAWLRFNGSSMAVTLDWLEQYFIDNPSQLPQA